jgi:hypothetical protein
MKHATDLTTRRRTSLGEASKTLLKEEAEQVLLIDATYRKKCQEPPAQARGLV